LITAVIPTFRRPQLLLRAVESVLAQTWPRLAVFVSDNASGDETPEILRALQQRDARLRFVVQKENLGAARNFQYCLEQVDTPWVSLLSDDDALLPGFYAHAMERLRAHRQARFFGGQVVGWNAQDGRHGLHPDGGWSSRLYEAGEAGALMARRLLIWTGCVFATDLFAESGSLSEDTFGDLDFQVCAAAAHPFVASMKPCAVFTIWPGGALQGMSGAELRARAAATREAIATQAHLSPADGEAIRSYLDRLPVATLTRRLKAALREGRLEAFDRTAADLQGLGRLRLGQRCLIWAGRRRGLLGFVRRAYGRHLVHRRARRRQHTEGPETLTFEEAMVHYAPLLAGPGTQPACSDGPACTDRTGGSDAAGA